MRQRIMQGWPFTPEEREQILKYCMSDVDSMVRVLPRILSDIEHLGIALYHGEFAAVSAVMEHHGVPIDMEIFQQLADKDVWRAVRDEMVPAIDAQYGVYVRRNNSSDWTFSHEMWIAYLKREGIYDAWPRLASGALDMRRKTFEDMTKGFPQLEALRQLRHARDKMRRIKLAVGHDARNRTVLWPFKSKTGRTQPKASTWIFSPAVWLRSLIKPEPGMAVAYVDYSSMEFLIAASLSDGHCGPVNNMLDMYRTGDPYLSFAKSVGAVPQTATKKSHETVRDRYKIMLLSTQYGLSATSLAARLNIPTFDAHEMLSQHHQQFAQYWAWSDDYVAHALQTGVVRTAFGWTYRIGIVGPVNDRSLRNWPIQSTGADILRIACILAVRHGIKLLAPVHDAVLIEAPIDRIEADVALMQEIMRRASRIVLNATADGTHELRTDAKIIRFPDRYTDKRGDGDLGPGDRAAGPAPAAAGGRAQRKESVMDDWAKKRLSELEAAAPVKRRNRKDAFVQVPLRWFEAATRATRSPQALVSVWLLHLAWKAKSPTFPVPNGQLGQHGVSRYAKYRALARLERAGLITVDRRVRKTLIVTLVGL